MSVSNYEQRGALAVPHRLGQRSVSCIKQAVFLKRLLILGVVLQLVAFYHVVYVLFGVRETPPLLFRVLAWSPVFWGFLLSLCWSRGLSKPGNKYWSLVWILCLVTTSLSLVIGIATHEQIRYFCGDFLRFATPWAALFVGLIAFRALYQHAGVQTLESLIDVLALIALFDGCVTIAFGCKFWGYKISTYFFTYGICWAFLQKRRSFWTSIVLLCVSIIAAIVSSKRANFVCLSYCIVASSLCLVWLRGVSTGVLKVAATVFLLLAVGMCFNSEALIRHAQKTSTQTREILLGGADSRGSMEYRDNEVKNIKLFLERNTNPLFYVTGGGFGFEVPAVYTNGVNVTDHGTMHHVHKGFWIYFLRNGMIGVVLLACFYYKALNCLIRNMSGTHGQEIAICLVYVSCRMLVVYSGNVMMEDIDVSVVLALGYVLAMVSRPPQTTQSMLPSTRVI